MTTRIIRIDDDIVNSHPNFRKKPSISNSEPKEDQIRKQRALNWNVFQLSPPVFFGVWVFLDPFNMMWWMMSRVGVGRRTEAMVVGIILFPLISSGRAECLVLMTLGRRHKFWECPFLRWSLGRVEEREKVSPSIRRKSQSEESVNNIFIRPTDLQPPAEHNSFPPLSGIPFREKTSPPPPQKN